MNTGADEFVPSWMAKPGAENDKKGRAPQTAGGSAGGAAAAPKLVVDFGLPSKKKSAVVIGAKPAAPAPAAAPATDVPEAKEAPQDSAPPPEVQSKPDETSDISAKLESAVLKETTKEPPAASVPVATEPTDDSGKEAVAAPPAEEDVDDDALGEVESAAISEESDGRKTVNIVFIGHVDAGKSTISGHILYLTGGVDDRTMEKFEREAKAKNRESWKYAWAMDLADSERDKGKTEECGRASFVTETRRFVLLDAPGHKSYVPSMITGASQADVGMLVISARKGEFETGFEKGGQTREHAMLAKTSGVRQLVILINKLDDPSIVNPDGTWSKERYDECCSKLMPFLKQVGWKPGDCSWIPVSGLTGINLKTKVDPQTCPWYEGESLLDLLEHLRPPERLLNAPVKLPVNEKYKEMGGTMLMGKLEAGTINVGDKLVLMPQKTEITVEAIHLEEFERATAEPGDNVRLRIKGAEEEDVKIGFVACTPTALVTVTDVFDVRLMILEHKSIITAGYSAVIHIHALVEEFVIEKLIGELDRKTGQIAKKFPKFAKPGQTVIARIRLNQPICVEEFKVFPQLGRFMIRDEQRTVGVGIVLKVRENNSAGE
ncbi:Eukaryotic peptide chain release factor GTP-binding subunit ERF3A [Porphyridium purpureum]|uniref:Eukaryotic peptide chain release factor GTP-binding subunit ERF3A n=1 Tax=Porphyridium purpureum TaxID=35688 RepID=A0A5J4Z8Q0_PORPP|nr:Eukaryotic peptide chain release factor GTP-binding subunit ERF3A [Porphyridium purpureum]|eukprot:POR6750..scf295_1